MQEQLILRQSDQQTILQQPTSIVIKMTEPIQPYISRYVVFFQYFIWSS